MKRSLLYIGIFLLILFAFFWKFIFLGKIPIPGDILLGTYYPWLNSHWGFPAGVPVKNPLMSDIVSLQYPWRFIAVNYLKSGQLPLWDPSSFLGTSLIGNFQAGIFNPFNVLFFLPIGFNYVWGVQVLLQPFLAMVCMYILLRSWKLSSPGVLLGSVAYGLSAPMLIWMEYNTHGFAIAVFPLFMFFISQYIERKNYLYFLGLSALVAFVIFAGYPQFLYYFLLAAFVYLCVFLYRKTSQRLLIKAIFFFIFFVALGLGLCAIQLIPGAEALKSSIRNVDKVAISNSVISLPFKNILMGIAPDYFGNPATYNYWGSGYYESFAFYTSLVALALSLWSFKNKEQKKRTVLLAIFALGSLLFSLPTPIVDLIQKLAILGLKGSVASRILFIYSFSISALGAIGMDFLIKSKNMKKIMFLDLIVPSVLVGITLGTVVSYYLIKVLSRGDFRNELDYLNNLSVSIRNLAWPLLITFASSLLIILLRRWKVTVGYLLLLLLTVDMFKFGWKYLPFTPQNQVFPKTPTLSFLEEQNQPFRIGIEQGELLTANTWAPYNLESVSGYNILLPQSTADYLSFLNSGKEGEANARFVDVHNFDSKLLDMANARYFLVLKRDNGIPDEKGELPYFIDLKNPRYKVAFQEGAVAVIKNTDALDRFYTVDSFRVLQDSKRALSYINSKDFDPGNEVVLDQKPDIGNIQKCKINPLTYKGESFTLQTDCPKEGILVVSNAFHPGWQALINGQKTKILKANGNFLAIVVPKGVSKSSFVFSPDSFWLGLKVSVISFIVSIFIFATIILTRKKIIHENRN